MLEELVHEVYFYDRRQEVWSPLKLKNRSSSENHGEFSPWLYKSPRLWQCLEHLEVEGQNSSLEACDVLLGLTNV